MAYTGKLGTADSQLGNMLLAYAGAEATLPSTGTMGGKLGEPAAMLGNLLIALSGPDGPKVFNVSAASTLIVTQSTDDGAEIIGHAPPAWAMGSADWQLGDSQLGFTGPDEALPAIGTRSGRLGVGLGSLALALGGAVGGQIINLSAASTLELACSASCDADIIGHPSPRWAIGGSDCLIGNTQLAYVEIEPSPVTGEMTGKLGTFASLLGNMRPALGEEEGEGTGGIINVSAGSALELSQSAGLQAVFDRSASSELTLDHLASFTKVVNVSADSPLSMTTEAAVTTAAWGHALSAESSLSLASEATVTTGVWLHEVSATSVLALTQEANGALGTVYDLSAASTLSLSQESTVSEDQWILDLSANSTLALTQEAAVTTDQWIHELSAGNVLALSQEALGAFIIDASVESQLTLDQEVTAGFIRTLTAGSTLTFSQEAAGFITHEYELDAESWLEDLDQSASTVNVFNRTAASTIELSQSHIVARPWYLSAESVLQETHQEFIPGTIEIIEVTTGLDSSASVITVLNRAASSTLAVGQQAGFSFEEPGGIFVSAVNTLDLDQNAWITQLGQAASALSLTQSATVQKGPQLGSQLDLGQAAGVTVVRNRAVDSEMGLEQAATYILVKHGAVELFDYAPAGLPPLQGPFPGVTSPFSLIYPAEGSPTDTIELRPPDFGNKDRLSFDRINRESRGGTLTIFADPNWPKVQTLALTFPSLRRTEACELIRFIREHLGLEIKLSDWEQRVWKGVITTPDEPVIQDGKDQFSAGFEFEGELLSA